LLFSSSQGDFSRAVFVLPSSQTPFSPLRKDFGKRLKSPELLRDGGQKKKREIEPSFIPRSAVKGAKGPAIKFYTKYCAEKERERERESE
jgi:hypothetical protein